MSNGIGERLKEAQDKAHSDVPGLVFGGVGGFEKSRHHTLKCLHCWFSWTKNTGGAVEAARKVAQMDV